MSSVWATNSLGKEITSTEGHQRVVLCVGLSEVRSVLISAHGVVFNFFIKSNSQSEFGVEHRSKALHMKTGEKYVICQVSK